MPFVKMSESKMFQPPLVPYYVLSYDEFDTLVQENLGVNDYNVCADNEWSNDTSYSYTDIKNDKSAEAQRSDAQEVIAGAGYGPYFAAVPLLYELVCQGFLPEGNYLIKVCW